MTSRQELPAGEVRQSGLAVTRQVAAERANWAVFAAVALLVGLAYSVLLPFDYTQRLSLANWAYMDGRYVFFALAFGLGLAWVVTLQVHALRRLGRQAGRPPRAAGPLGALAGLVALLPSLLCCSPVVPTLVSLLGLSAATRLRTTGRVQYFFATQQDWLLVGALVLLVASGIWSTRRLARAVCGPEGCGPSRSGDGPAPACDPPACGPLERQGGRRP